MNDFKKDGNYSKEIHFTPNFSASSGAIKVRMERITASVHSTGLFSGSAVDYIRNDEGDQPFFLYRSFLAPHDPRTMPEQFRNMYGPEQITLPPNYMEMPVVNCGWSNKGRDENTVFGQQYWQQWRQYEAAAVHGMGRPKGSNMANQVKDWGTEKQS